ncbi:MAG: hypothetical protein IJ748_03620 [Bacteroidales bacterium]|nr:hypothetical protein [Bacteroidales bacterium]
MKKTCILFNLLCLIFFSSCIKDLEDENIYSKTIISGVVLQEENNNPVKNINVKLTDGENIPQAVVTNNNGEFYLKITNEQISKDYYLDFSADSLFDGKQVKLSGIKYGRKEFSIGTVYLKGGNIPTVYLQTIHDISVTSARITSKVTAGGKSSVVARGICYSTSQYPTISDNHSTDGSGLGEFVSNLQNLSANTTYYVRAYAQNYIGTAYSEQFSFTTLDGLPMVFTNEITNIAATSVTCGGNATYDNGFPITEKGVCWSMSNHPTVINDYTTNGAYLGSFVSNITGLQPNTSYYICAWAKNRNGIAYGEIKTFTTLSGLPVIESPNIVNIYSSTATINGEISSDGGFLITQRGICYSTSSNPTTSSLHTTDGTGMGSFVSYLTNLQPNTTYYIKAYATNSIGTSYSTEISFKTE